MKKRIVYFTSSKQKDQKPNFDTHWENGSMVYDQKEQKPVDLSEMMVHKEPYIAPVPTPMVADEQRPAEWSEKRIADIFEKVGLAKIAREQGNDELTNAIQDAMLELSKLM